MCENSNNNPEKCEFCGGDGEFDDFDSRYSYGIPVCSRCGGIGNCPSDPEFKMKIEKIRALRHKYCPIKRDFLFPMHKVYLLQIIEELIEKVTELFNEYGIETDESYARMVSEGELQFLADGYKNEISERILQLKDMVHNQPSYFNKQMIEIELAIWEGREFAKVEEMFQNLMEDYSTLSEFHFVHANFLISFSHFEEAIPVLEKAMELETDIERKVAILYALARCLYIMNKGVEAVQTAHKALKIIKSDSVLKKDLEKFIKKIK